MTLKNQVTKICRQVKLANASIANLDTKSKNAILFAVADQIHKHQDDLIAANQLDIKNAQAKKLDTAKIDRLLLDKKRIANLAETVEQVAKLADPVGKIIYDVVNPNNNLHIRRITVPIGVLLVIYESRPNVTSDVAALAIKSGNSVILRSGSESFNSSQKIAQIYQQVLEQFKVDPNNLCYVNDTNRDYIKLLLKMDNYIDVVIPRGGKDLINAISKNTKIPIFKHLDGNCHTYIESAANLEKARKIVFNAKMRRVGICGATESLLVDQEIAAVFLPYIIDDLIRSGCEIRGDNQVRKIDARVKKIANKDYYTEYLDKIISVKIVKNINQAIEHINHYGSSHTESIITEDQKQAEIFFKGVNSAIVMHNASTQFADGGEFGLGAEVGIATGKLHARGPVGLEQLVTYKYLVEAECGLRK